MTAVGKRTSTPNAQPDFVTVEQTVIFNVGSDDHVTLGMVFVREGMADENFPILRIIDVQKTTSVAYFGFMAGANEPMPEFKIGQRFETRFYYIY